MRKSTQLSIATRRILGPLVICLVVLAASLYHVQTAQAATRSGHDTIILIHGYNGTVGNNDGSGFNCDSLWSGVKSFMGQSNVINGQSLTWSRQDYREISFYNGDTSCGGRGSQYPYPLHLTNGSICYSYCEDLHNSIYKSHCSGYYPDGTNSSQDGTTGESIYHLSCLFAWYLHLNFQPSWNVEIVGWSMGGLITRNAIYQVQDSKATWTMPNSLPNISDVVTFGTPHAGTPWGLFGFSTQANEMVGTSSFIGEMQNSAPYPQWGGTDWSMISSACDGWVSAASATAMGNGHRTVFDSTTSPTCYGHDGYLTDTSSSWDAPFDWCDGSACPTFINPGNPGWHQTNGPHSLYHMAYALWLSNW